MNHTRKVIWYLHPYAGAPDIGMSYRPYYLCSEFRKLNYDAYIISASYHHLLTRSSIQKDIIKQEFFDDVPYLWLRTNHYKGNSWGRIRNMLTYALRIQSQAKNLVKITGNPDIIIVSSTHPFHYFSAANIAKKYQSQLIFEVRDLWPLSLIELLNIHPIHPLCLALSYIEKKAYLNADKVVSVLPNGFEYMCHLGLTDDRYFHIPNGIETTLSLGNTPLPDNLLLKINHLKSQHKFIIVYAGAHGVPNALHVLISALKILQTKNIHNIHAILVGQGLEKKRLQEEAKDLKNISFFDPIPKTSINNLLQQSDVCYIGWNNKRLYQYGVSANKIFDYMLAAKPIIHAVNTQNDPVELANCGIIIPPENPERLARAIHQLSQLGKPELYKMGQRGNAYVKEHHDYQHLAKQYAALFV